MKSLLPLCASLALTAAGAAGWEERFDRLGDFLRWASPHDAVRARLSGTLDLEGYAFGPAAPGLIFTHGDALFNPRLSAFLHAQCGSQVYIFAQARLDRGFDPTAARLRGRLDEYAIRFSPGIRGRLNLQAGKFATVIGNWVGRHDSWHNPFVTAPLPYEHALGIFDGKAADSAATLQRWPHLAPDPVSRNDLTGSYRLPMVWGPAYASGAALSGALGAIDYAVEFKNTAPSARPGRWSATETAWAHPTFAGRIGYRHGPGWNFGVSASAGSYLSETARPTLAPGRGLGDYRQVLWAQDIAYAWRHFQLWAEAYHARFESPGAGQAEALAYYLEAKYKLSPQFSAALRWNQQLRARITDETGRHLPWAGDVRRLDAAVNHRLTPHLGLKLQYSVQDTSGGPRLHLFASQFTARF